MQWTVSLCCSENRRCSHRDTEKLSVNDKINSERYRTGKKISVRNHRVEEKTDKIAERNGKNQKTGNGIIGRDRQVADRGEQIYSRYVVRLYRSNEHITAPERNRTA